MEPRRRLTNEAYTMGWICASLLDLAAAKAMMEERHLALRQHPADKNEYTLGRVGEYNIVVVCLPAEQAGAIAAAVAATRMMYSFGKIKFVFMVGTGGGVPNKHNDIRLGDVVVGVPSPGKAAVVQYDFGKDTVNDFELFGSLRPPPPDLLAIVGALRTEHGSEHIQLTNHLSAIDGSFAYPGVEHDLLFNSDYEHPSDSDLICSGCDRGELIQRERKNTEGVVHYGSIGSSNMCMSNTKRRERLRKDLGVLCLETESAGLMNDFPCLAIQGVSNYADSHADATKQWEKYAAATAAAYTTGLLKFMSTNTYIREAESSARGQSAVSTGVYSQPQPALEGDESQRPVLSTPPPNSSETDESFGSSMPSMLKKVFFFHNKYGTRSILLFLCRSDDAWCTISEKLRCGSCGKGFWKSQSHNCAMAGVGSTIVALIAITSLLLPFTGQVHWITRALWIVSMLSAFLSVLFVCKHQMIIGHLVLVEEHHEHHEGSSRTNDLLRKEGSSNTTPHLSAVLLFSISRAFFDYALVAYIIGLGTYLGFVWQYNLDVQAGPFDSRNIFIVFMVYGGFCICIYCLPTYPEPYEWPWTGDSKATKDTKDRSRGSKKKLEIRTGEGSV